MPGWAARTIVSGSLASLTSTAALALLSRLEGYGALQPINATSHWLNGERAARVTAPDGRHTCVGYATHHAATVFWAAFFEFWMGWRPPVGRAGLVSRAAAMAVIAAAVDYGATPRRFTPGWEFVLSRRAMAGAYAAMAAGFVMAARRRP